MPLRVWRLPADQGDLMQPSHPAADHQPGVLQSIMLTSPVLQDVHDCLQHTGCEGVMSAEALLEDPALFWPQRLTDAGDPFLHIMRTCGLNQATLQVQAFSAA